MEEKEVGVSLVGVTVSSLKIGYETKIMLIDVVVIVSSLNRLHTGGENPYGLRRSLEKIMMQNAPIIASNTRRRRLLKNRLYGS